jgi:hypothetical protein
MEKRPAQMTIRGLLKGTFWIAASLAIGLLEFRSPPVTLFPYRLAVVLCFVGHGAFFDRAKLGASVGCLVYVAWVLIIIGYQIAFG